MILFSHKRVSSTNSQAIFIRIAVVGAAAIGTYFDIIIYNIFLFNTQYTRKVLVTSEMLSASSMCVVSVTHLIHLIPSHLFISIDGMWNCGSVPIRSLVFMFDKMSTFVQFSQNWHIMKTSLEFKYTHTHARIRAHILSSNNIIICTLICGDMCVWTWFFGLAFAMSSFSFCATVRGACISVPFVVRNAEGIKRRINESKLISGNQIHD